MLKDLRTKSIVLRRTNFGESDRILNLLTENGYQSVIAKGVRKEKSKLAGGIEMFCLSEITIHAGKNNKLGILTSAKMLKAYNKIIIDLEKLELASTVLKQINKVAENSTKNEYFDLLNQTLAGINDTKDLKLIESWFLLNYAKTNGDEINLHRDVTGAKLDPYKTYIWDTNENCLREQIGGNIGANAIKLMRLMVSSKFDIISRVKDVEVIIPSILHIAKAINKI